MPAFAPVADVTKAVRRSRKLPAEGWIIETMLASLCAIHGSDRKKRPLCRAIAFSGLAACSLVSGCGKRNDPYVTPAFLSVECRYEGTVGGIVGYVRPIAVQKRAAIQAYPLAYGEPGEWVTAKYGGATINVANNLKAKTVMVVATKKTTATKDEIDFAKAIAARIEQLPVMQCHRIK